MNVPMLTFEDSSAAIQYECQAFASAHIHITDSVAEVDGSLPGTSGITIQVEKGKNESEVAVCIPSKPLEVIALRARRSELLLRAWWDEWGFNIARGLGSMITDVGPIFLVLQKTDTDQAANCYYMGKESKTRLCVSGNIADKAKISIEAGFSCQEIGAFGFKNSVRQFNGQKWSIFIRNEKLRLVRFLRFKRMIIGIWLLQPLL